MGDCLVKPGTGRSHAIRDIIMCIAIIFADIPALLKAFSVYQIWFKIIRLFYLLGTQWRTYTRLHIYGSAFGCAGLSGAKLSGSL